MRLGAGRCYSLKGEEGRGTVLPPLGVGGKLLKYTAYIIPPKATLSRLNLHEAITQHHSQSPHTPVWTRRVNVIKKNNVV